MYPMYEVSPADVHLCGSRVHETSTQWGVEALRLSEAAQHPARGPGRVAEALRGVHERMGPPAQDLVDQTGFCLAEVSVVVHAMADAYQRTEDLNASHSDRIGAALGSLGLV